MIIRQTKHDDTPALQAILDGTDLFPSEILPDMLDDFLGNREEGEVWLTCEEGGAAIGFCYAVPEALAEGTWNMLAIAVLPGCQGRGAGSLLVKHLEAALRDGEEPGRILIADTSGTDAFARTRDFYRGNGYVEEARIREFWGEGDDKVVFWKSLA